MTNYIVMTGDGDLLCDGASAYEIERVAEAEEYAERVAEVLVGLITWIPSEDEDQCL